MCNQFGVSKGITMSVHIFFFGGGGGVEYDLEQGGVSYMMYLNFEFDFLMWIQK